MCNGLWILVGMVLYYGCVMVICCDVVDCVFLFFVYLDESYDLWLVFFGNVYCMMMYIEVVMICCWIYDMNVLFLWLCGICVVLWVWIMLLWVWGMVCCC